MKIFWAFLTACGVTVTCAIVCAFIFNGLGPWGAFFSALIGFLLALVAFQTCGSAGSDGDPCASPSFIEWALLAIFAMVSFRSFFWLIYPAQGAWHVLSPYNLGDLSLHIQFIRYCALGVPFWPESPLLTNTPLVYPLGVDLLNTVIVLLGGDLLRSLVWVGSVGAALTAFALWQWGGGFALAAFLFAGGTMSFSYLLGGSGHLDFSQKHIEWKNLFLSLFVTQRGWLYALPLGLGLLCEWRREYRHLEEKKEGVPLWLQAVLLGTLPLFHVHTFLFLSVVLVCYFLFLPGAQKRPLQLLLLSAVPAAICMWLVSGGFQGGWAFQPLPGWLQKGHSAPFWWSNFGLWLILWLVLLFFPPVYRDAEARCILIASSAVFLFCCFFSIAPSPWDNTKWMIWGYLAVSPLLWRKLLAPLPLLLKATLCGFLFFSGAVALLGGMRSPGYSLISLAELRAIEASLQTMPPFSRLAAAPDYNHPLVLSGRKRVAGYEGHLWSYGLPYQPVFAKLDRLMKGESDWKSLAYDLHADFLFWGPREEMRYPDSKKPWLTQAPVVMRSAYGTIYDLR